MKLLLALGYIGSASAASSCQVCSASKNYKDEFVGATDEGRTSSRFQVDNTKKACWDGDKQFEQDCGEDSVCVSEMLVDWLPRGGHQYVVRRFCDKPQNKFPDGTCDARTSNAVQYKDCKITCEDNNCNNDFDTVANLLNVGKVESCWKCSYFQNSDGTVDGQSECLEEIGLNSNIDQEKCPIYANAGCSTASSAHKSYNENETDDYVKDEFRGCSPFENVNICYDTQINGLDHESCKSTCTTNNCNIFKHQMRQQCYTCTSTRGTSGMPLGTGDERCWDEDKLDDGMLADCDYNEEYCAVEVKVDYMALGNQQAWITRGCRRKAPSEKEEECNGGENETAGTAWKDCLKMCSNEEGPCNKDLNHEDLFEGTQDSCYSCYDIDRLDGSVSGNADCVKSPENVSDGTAECPYWAKEGCYQTISSHYVGTDSDSHEDAYRGCSAFQLKKSTSEDAFQCTNFQVDIGPPAGDVKYNTCKKTCTGKNCNNEYENPLLESAVASCLVCTVTVDANNQTIGIGDDRCWEGTDQRGLLQACPANQQYCITDMEVDWLPRGEVQYRVRRGCSARPAATNCFAGQSDLIQYKDCQESCDTGTGIANGCNTGLDAIAARFAPAEGEPSVTECKTCSYFQKEDGKVEGNINCKENPDRVATQACPAYASTACYEASSFHKSYGTLGDNQVEDDYRGCSTFSLPVVDEENPTAANCAVADINGLAHQNCKRTCTDDGCNVHRLQNRHTCYQCEGTRNAQGKPIGVGDDRCFEHPSENSLVDCKEGEDFCVDDLIIDWLPRGDQVARIVRGCSKEPKDECIGSDLPMTAYKDCTMSCKGDKCNDNFEVAKKFRPNDIRTYTCQACEYQMLDDGTEVGNQFCQNPTGPDFEQNFNASCPDYAQYGCFTGASTHLVDGEAKVEIYKGCSTFPLSGNGYKEYEYQDDNANNFQVVKTYCTEEIGDWGDQYYGCNEEVKLPGSIEDNQAIECYQCSVTVDQNNNTIGTGERTCWDQPQERYLQKCSPTQTCAVDMQIDWMSRGMMMTRITRGCSNRKVDDPEPVCKEGATSLAQFKDCDVVCNESGCNRGLDEVAKRFDAGAEAVNECYQCSYSEGKDGSVEGAPFCGDSIADTNTTRVPVRQCPVYANRACYQASSLHEDYSDPSVDFEEDYRGCSTFEHTNGEDFTCQSTAIDQISHLNCKSSCKEDKCNTRGLQAGNTCASCKITYDTLYRPIGVGDIDCWFNVKDRHAVVCGDDQPYCTTELKVDWLGRGSQIYELSRGCSATKPPSTCIETSSKAVKTKDCFTYCENGQLPGGKDFCNNDIWSVTRLFRPDPENPLDGYYQPGCFGCSYTEKDDGTVEGNKHCYDPSLPEGPPIAFGPCPVHASSGCYTGSSKHMSPSGEEVNEVWKGCSVFTLDTTEKEQVELPIAGGGTSLHSIAKETCQGQGCNAATDRPDDFTTTTKVVPTTTDEVVVTTDEVVVTTDEVVLTEEPSTEPVETTTTPQSTTANSQSVLISLAALVMSLML